MAINKESWRHLIAFQTAWSGVLASIGKMYPSSDIRPKSAAEIFKAAESKNGGSQFTIGPVVFKVPEKPSKRDANLFVVVSGWIAFSALPSTTSQPNTLSFGTRVGYFRVLGEKLEHVYGAHYDMDETSPGHPVFHAQMASLIDMSSSISELFDAPFGVAENHASNILRNVRIPTAQMDAFSVFTQIGADHLVSEKSTPEVREAFDELRNSCDFFHGAAHKLSYLNATEAARCYRSTHWYERELVAKTSS
jgi:hypothetical protein